MLCCSAYTCWAALACGSEPLRKQWVCECVSFREDKGSSVMSQWKKVCNFGKRRLGGVLTACKEVFAGLRRVTVSQHSSEEQRTEPIEFRFQGRHRGLMLLPTHKPREGIKDSFGDKEAPCRCTEAEVQLLPQRHLQKASIEGLKSLTPKGSS